MHRKVAFFIAVIVACGAATSSADDFLLAQLYGSGVHAYNGGDYAKALHELTAAIQGGTIDPRAYYFRGLTDLRLGRQSDAAADFQKGAELETGDSNDVFPVSNSLARVQGPDRNMLERYREAARVTAHQRQEAARQAKYEQRMEAEKTVLRQVQPTELMPPPEGAEQTVPPAGSANDPFAEPKPVPSQQPAAPKTDETLKSDDPFGATPAKAAPPSGQPAETKKPAPASDPNPFGEPASKSKPEPAAAEAAAPASAQRFTKVANKLIQAINANDSATIQASLDAQMQQAMPPDKANPFFHSIVTAAGKLKDAGVPQVTGSTAIMRVAAERAAFDFKIDLDESDKISGLLITPAAADAKPAGKPAEKPAANKPVPQPAADENPFK